MENKVLQKNLDAISKYDSTLADKILMLDVEKSNLELIKTSQDEYNLLFNNIPLHSQNGAILEAKNIVKNIENKDNKNSVRLLYGLGLGYLLDELYQNIKNSKIIIYEPNLDILKLVFSIAEIDAIFHENVILCSDKEKLTKHVESISNENTEITITFLSSYKELFFDMIPAFIGSIIMAGIVKLVSLLNFNAFVEVCVQVVVGIFVYVLYSWIFKIDSFKYLLSLVWKMKRHRNKSVKI